MGNSLDNTTQRRDCYRDKNGGAILRSLDNGHCIKGVFKLMFSTEGGTE